MRVFAKYVDPEGEDENSAAWQNLAALVAQIASGSPSVVTDGSGYANSSYSQFPYPNVLDKSGETGGTPMAYLNYIAFDRDFNPIIDVDQTNFERVDGSAREHGNDGPHQELFKEITIKQAGYVYVYLSNDSPTPVEVFFDDFEVEQVKSPVIHMSDYYPFGLTFNSHQRENSVDQRYKFQGQERMDDLGLNWVAFRWRNHQPETGRFFNLDPLADKYVYNSPYAFSENHVTSHVELEGLEKVHFEARMQQPDGTTYAEGGYLEAMVNFTLDMNENTVTVTNSFSREVHGLNIWTFIEHGEVGIVDFEPEVTQSEDGSINVHGDLSFFGATDVNLVVKVGKDGMEITTNVDDIDPKYAVTITARDESTENQIPQVMVAAGTAEQQLSDTEIVNQNITIPLVGNPEEKIIFDPNYVKKAQEELPRTKIRGED